MAKCKYTVKENSNLGTHSFYAVPVSNGTLTTDEVVEEACENTTIEASIAKAVFTEIIKAVKRNVLKGFRVNLGDDFLTVYPNISCSVKDEKDSAGNVTTSATAAMVTAAKATSRLGATVNAKFSKQFAQEVSWQKVDQSGATVEDEDVTDSDSTSTTPSGSTSLDSD